MPGAEKLVFTRRHRVCAGDGPAGDGAVVARQLDAVLMCAGFKLSGGLLCWLGQMDAGYVTDRAVQVIGWARELAGAHVQHNAYFIDFPANVPAAEEFWLSLILESAREAAVTGQASLRGGLVHGSFVFDLLSLPGYGRYQHTFEEMLAHHDELIPLLADRVTVISLGGTAESEAAALYRDLAGSAAPLSGDDLEALRLLAGECTGMPVPDIPVRENRAVINAVRVRAGLAPAVASTTDVLRLAAELSEADVTLTRPPVFRSLPRAQRAAVMRALQGAADAGGFSEVPSRAELWKRVGERLHPHEFPQFPAAQDVFAAARGETGARSIASRAEEAFRAGNVAAAAEILSAAPGALWRAADRLLRAASAGDLEGICCCLKAAAPRVAGRVLLGVREHWVTGPAGAAAVFSRTAAAAHGWPVTPGRPWMRMLSRGCWRSSTKRSQGVSPRAAPW